MSDAGYHVPQIGDRVRCVHWDSGRGTVTNVDPHGEARWPYRVQWDEGALGFGMYCDTDLDIIGAMEPEPEEQFVEKVWNTPENPGFGPEYTINSDSPLLKAHALVHGERGRDYDHPYIDYMRTADIFRAMTGVELTVTQAVKFMLAVKLSRMQASPDVEDHLVDLAGYTECLHMVRQHEAILSEGGF